MTTGWLLTPLTWSSRPSKPTARTSRRESTTACSTAPRKFTSVRALEDFSRDLRPAWSEHSSRMPLASWLTNTLARKWLRNSFYRNSLNMYDTRRKIKLLPKKPAKITQVNNFIFFTKDDHTIPFKDRYTEAQDFQKFVTRNMQAYSFNMRLKTDYSFAVVTSGTGFGKTRFCKEIPNIIKSRIEVIILSPLDYWSTMLILMKASKLPNTMITVYLDSLQLQVFFHGDY